MKKVYIGTSGYNYNHWKGVFYPKDLSSKNWLEYYSKYFDTVEINATFYGRFKKEVFKHWGSQTPKTFIFVIKGSRYITHIKRINHVQKEIKNFFDPALGLGQKLSLVLWQFSPNFKYNDQNFDRLKIFLKQLPYDINQAIEVRNDSWFNDQFFDLLGQNKTGFVVNSSINHPSPEIITSNFAYIRFHGPGSLYSSSYSDRELKNWAEKIREYQKKVDVYCYFNNDVGGYAVKNALTLKKMLICP